MPDLTSPAPWRISAGYIADATGTKAVARFVPPDVSVIKWAGSPADDVTISNGMLLCAAPLLRDALVAVLPYAIAAIGRERSSWPVDSVILQAEAALRSATYLPFGPEVKS